MASKLAEYETAFKVAKQLIEKEMGIEYRWIQTRGWRMKCSRCNGIDHLVHYLRFLLRHLECK